MLENERIIVDRGGIDPGIAALMQNANKGFDPAALMATMNHCHQVNSQCLCRIGVSL